MAAEGSDTGTLCPPLSRLAKPSRKFGVKGASSGAVTTINFPSPWSRSIVETISSCAAGFDANSWILSTNRQSHSRCSCLKRSMSSASIARVNAFEKSEPLVNVMVLSPTSLIQRAAMVNAKAVFPDPLGPYKNSGDLEASCSIPKGERHSATH